MKETLKWFACVIPVLIISACSWVELTPEARKVQVVSKEEISRCKFLATTRVATLASFGLVDRYTKSINEELEALARGSAVDLGGNTLVPQTEVVDGRQTFAVYDCPANK